MVIRIVPTPYINAQTNYLFHWVTLLTHTKLGPDCHRQSLVAVGMNRAMWSLLRLNKTADCAKIVQNSPTVSSFVLKVITSPDATQLDKTFLLSRVASGDVIEALH